MIVSTPSLFENLAARFIPSHNPRGKMALDFVLPVTVTDRELEQLKKLLKKKRSYTNGDVEKLLGCSKGEASKRVKKAVKAGVVSKIRVGKAVAITLN